MTIARSVLPAGVATLFTMCSLAMADDVAGTLDKMGALTPRVTVSSTSHSITLRKVRQEEKCGNIEIRFISGRLGRDFSTRNVFLQWEKSTGPGKLWPIADQRTFDNKTKTYSGTWNDSPSFTIVDKSDRASFLKHPWDKVVSISIGGRKLRRLPVEPKVEGAESLGSSAALNTSADTTETAPPVSPEVRLREPSGLYADSRTAAGDQEQPYQALLKRTQQLEGTVCAMRKQIYWGGLSVLALLSVFSCMTLFPRLAGVLRKSASGTMASIDYYKLKLRPGLRFPHAG